MRNLGGSNADADGEVIRATGLLPARPYYSTPTAASGWEAKMTVEKKQQPPFNLLIVPLDLSGDKAVVFVLFLF